jgi:D-aminopeptidase
MSHTSTVKRAFLNKRAQSHLKPAHALVVETWKVLIPICRTVVMKEGRQKSKRISLTAKFKCEAIRCAEEKGNHKAAAIFGVDESNV